jgi:hypothetical protein
MPKKYLFQFNYGYLGHKMPRTEVGFPKFKLLYPPYPLKFYGYDPPMLHP